MARAVKGKPKHSCSAQHKSEHKEAEDSVPKANGSKCKQNPVRLRVQPTAMEGAEALLLLGFRRRAPPAYPASGAVQRVCRERTSKQWNALLTQTKSRIGHRCGMRKRLGEAHWAAFVRYAEAEHKAQFFRAMAPASSGELHCEGKLGGTQCPNGAQIDLQHISSTPTAALRSVGEARGRHECAIALLQQQLAGSSIIVPRGVSNVPNEHIKGPVAVDIAQREGTASRLDATREAWGAAAEGHLTSAVKNLSC